MNIISQKRFLQHYRMEMTALNTPLPTSNLIYNKYNANVNESEIEKDNSRRSELNEKTHERTQINYILERPSQETQKKGKKKKRKKEKRKKLRETSQNEIKRYGDSNEGLETNSQDK